MSKMLELRIDAKMIILNDRKCKYYLRSYGELLLKESYGDSALMVLVALIY